MGYKTIICGVTGFLHSQKAALEAAILAGQSHAELIYVYIVDVSFLGAAAPSHPERWRIRWTDWESSSWKLPKSLPKHKA